MTPLTAAIGAFILTALMCSLIVGRILHTTDQRHKEQKAIIFDLSQAVEDLEQQKSPTYQVRAGAVDPVVRRNRPDVIRRQPTQPSGDTTMIDVADIPDWSPKGDSR